MKAPISCRGFDVTPKTVIQLTVGLG